MDRALECEAAQDRELQGHLLVAYEQLRALQEMIETERSIASAAERATRYAVGLRPLRAVSR